MTRLAAAAAAWFAPSAVLAWILLATGQNPAAALAYGWTGIAGAAAYVVVHGVLERRRRRAEFDEDVAQAFLSADQMMRRVSDEGRLHRGENAVPLNDDIAITHEGLARLHADIRRDAERRPE